jgi:hypothetical protein
MAGQTRILLKTTIGPVIDDWHIGRFSLLATYLASIKSDSGSSLFNVIARDRAPDAAGDDCDLALLGEGGFDQLWLFAVDVVGGLTSRDVERISKFRERGGGCLLTRDHQDLGACLTRLGALGATQHFQNVNPEAEAARQCCDDTDTATITWPNYHSGANGDVQEIAVAQPVHPLMRRSSGGVLQYLPSHPHEGAVGIPQELGSTARVVARGRSLRTGRRFNLCVAVEEAERGRAVSDSSFHHFCDYNWDPRSGAPSFVDEPPGDAILHNSDGLADAHQYAGNIALWLAGKA